MLLPVDGPYPFYIFYIQKTDTVSFKVEMIEHEDSTVFYLLRGLGSAAPALEGAKAPWEQEDRTSPARVLIAEPLPQLR